MNDQTARLGERRPAPAAAAASTIAGRTDTLFVTMVLLCGAIALAASASRSSSSACATGPVRRSTAACAGGKLGLEVAWITIPLVLFIGLFIWAGYDFVALYRVPDDALPVYVVAKQWMWKLQHRNGRREINELHVPLGQPVRLVMTSQDAIHSFFVPAFRLKQDVLPGRYTGLWFTATQLGEFHLFCAEYCGSDHSRDGRPQGHR